jgi:hypothetical protein
MTARQQMPRLGDDQSTALFRALCKRVGLPEPRREYKFAHPDRAWRFDFAWVDRGVALEVEGGAWSGGRHTRGKGFLADMEKYNAAALRGWLLFRCTPQTLDTLETVEMVRLAYETRV